MSRIRSLIPGLFACALVATATGCPSTQKQPDEGEGRSGSALLVLLKDSELYTGIPEEIVTIHDEDLKFAPDKDADAEVIARWVTERRNVISWCLSRDQTVSGVNEIGTETIRYKKVFPGTMRPETRLDQAISIGKKVVDKVPDATRERYRFAESLFSRGSFEFWQMDALEQDIFKLKSDKRDEDARQKEGLLKEHGERMAAYQTLAIQNFRAYMGAYPMDKTALDWIWKCYFQLGNFQDAVATLDQLLDSDILKDKARQRYLEIRNDIVDYLRQRQLDPRTPKPGSRERPLKTDIGAGPG